MTHREALARAFEQVTTWMTQHDADVIVQNLAAGATDAQLAAAETALGFPLHAELRALWSLHDGQPDDGNGFFEAFYLFSVAQAIAERENVLLQLAFAREDPADATSGGLTADELASDAWLPFVGRDSDVLAVHATSGRVFECLHDDSPPKLVAASIVEWANHYARRVLADDYRVEEGFGDRYLETRDRDEERREQKRERLAAEKTHRLATAPIQDLLQEAIARGDDRDCGLVIESAQQRSDASLFEAIALLFAGGAAPELIAGTLRSMLSTITLSPAQWSVVAEGGARLGNNAIRDVALARGKAAEATYDTRTDVARTPKPWWKRW